MFGKIITVIAVLLILWKRGEICAGVARAVYARGKSENWRKWYAFAEKIGGMKFNNRLTYAYLILKEGDPDAANKKFALLSMERLTREQKLQLKASYALVYWKRGEVDTAIEMLEEVINSAKTTSTYGSLGYMYAFNGNLSKALEFNQEAYEYNSTNPIIVDNLAFTYYKVGEYARAREYYEKLMALKPTFPEAFYGYGRLLVEMGETEAGLEMVRKALSANFSYLTVTDRQEILDYLEEFEDDNA